MYIHIYSSSNKEHSPLIVCSLGLILISKSSNISNMTDLLLSLRLCSDLFLLTVTMLINHSFPFEHNDERFADLTHQ